MFSLVFALSFLFLALIAIGIGVLRGRKYTWQLSTARIIVLILSVIVSIAISALISWFAGGAIIDFLKNILSGALSDAEFDLAGLIEAIPALPGFVRALLASVMASLIFLPIFWTVKGIANRFASVPIAKLLLKIGKKKEEKADEAEIVVQNADQTDAESATDNAEQMTETEEVVEAVEAVETVEAENAPKVKMSKKKRRLAPFKSTHKFDALGAVLGGLCGLLFLVVMLSPLVGNLRFANNIIKMASGSSDETMATVVEISDAAAENAGSKGVHILGGGLIYRGLSTYPVNGEMIAMDKELELIGSFVSALTNITNEDVSEKESADSLRAVGANFEKAKVIPMIIADLISAASDNWSRGEDFCGIELISIGEPFDSVINDFIVIMKDATYETVSEDVSCMLRVVALLVENDALGEVEGGEGGLGAFSNEELLSAVIIEFLNNDRLAPLSASVTNIAISTFSYNLNMIENDQELYDKFMSEMSAVYEEVHGEDDNAHKAEWLAEEIFSIYDKYGISISRGVAHCIAIDMIDDESVTDEGGIKNFFTPHSHTLQNVLGSGRVEVSYLSKPALEERDATEFIDSIAMRANKYILEDDLKAIVAEELRKLEIADDLSDEDIEQISNTIAEELIDEIRNETLSYDEAEFADAKEMGKVSAIVTADALKVWPKTIADGEKEAKALAAVFKNLFVLVEDVIEYGQSDIERIIGDLGPLFDAFADCQTIGADTAKDILVGTLQSRIVINNTGLTVGSATDIAYTINNGKDNGENYTALMKTLGNTVNIIKVSSESGNTTEAVKELIKDITPTSAQTLQKLSTPDMVKSYGVSDKSAKPVSEMMSDMFGNMSKAKEEKNMTDEEYEKEAAAVNDMMNIAMSASESKEKNTFGENSSTGLTAGEFVDRAVDSVIISETLVNKVYGGTEEAQVDPLATGKNLSANEKNEMVESLDAKWKAQLAASSDPVANEAYKQVLTSIAALVNIQVEFVGNSVVEVA